MVESAKQLNGECAAPRTPKMTVSPEISPDIPRVNLPAIRKFALILFAVAATFVGRAYTAMSHGALSIDAQLFAYIGQGWAHGLLPYRDLWDHKPPGIFAVDAAVLRFWPDSFTALAFVESIVILGVIFVACLLAREIDAQPGITAFVTAIAANLEFYNEGGNLTETYLLLPEILSAYMFVRFLRTGKLRDAFVSGLFAGIAAIFKPVGIAPLLAALACSLFQQLRTRALFGRFIKTSAALCLGAVAAWIPFVAYFWSKGLLGAMFFASFTYNFRYIGFGLKGIHKLAVLVFLEPAIVLVAAALVLAYMFLIKSREQRALPWLYLVLWAGADISGGLAGGRYYPHYLLPAVVSLAVCFGVAFSQIASYQQRWVTPIAILTLSPLLLMQGRDLMHLRSVAGSTLADKVASDINHDAARGSGLFCWDYLPDVYLETGLRSPTPYLFAFRMIYDEQHATEIVNTLERNPPSYLVFDADHPLDPRLREVLSTGYEPWKSEGDLAIYKYHR